LEDRDGLRWIKDLATEFPSIPILIVSRQSEWIYAERGLRDRCRGPIVADRDRPRADPCHSESDTKLNRPIDV
jgi:DNA-binding NarL/FixJ family response regulator